MFIIYVVNKVVITLIDWLMQGPFQKIQTQRLNYNHFAALSCFLARAVAITHCENEMMRSVHVPLVPLWVASVSRRSPWLERLNRRWMRPRSLTLSSLSEDGMERLRSSSMDRSESESESSPGKEGQGKESRKKEIKVCISFI